MASCSDNPRSLLWSQASLFPMLHVACHPTQAISSKLSMICYRKHSVLNAAIRVAGRTRLRLLTPAPPSIFAHLAATKRYCGSRSYSVEMPSHSQNPRRRNRTVAIIDESLCIGCTHCRNACPVDAIVGAHQLMHTIIASECTGCELCVAPCPVDCISVQTVS